MGGGQNDSDSGLRLSRWVLYHHWEREQKGNMSGREHMFSFGHTKFLVVKILESSDTIFKYDYLLSTFKTDSVFIWLRHVESLVAECELLVAAHGI